MACLLRGITVGMLLTQNVAQERYLDPLFLALLAEALTLCLERVLRAPQRLNLVLKLRDGGSPPVGLLRSLYGPALQIFEVGNELIVMRDDLFRFPPNESIVYPQLLEVAAFAQSPSDLIYP